VYIAKGVGEMERIEGLSIGLDLDSAGLNRGLTGLKDRLKTVNSEMKANLSAFDRGERSVAKYETIITGLNRKLQVQESITTAARQEYEKMVQEHGEGSQEAEKAARSYNNEVAALNNLQRRLQNTERELADFREEQRQAESGFTRLGTRITNTGESLTKFGDKAKNAGTSLTASLTAPIAGLGIAAGKSALEFDKASGSIQAELGITEKQAEELNKVAQDLWKEGFGDSIEGVSTKVAGVTKSLGDLSKVDLSYVTKGLELFEQKGWGDQRESLRAIKVLMEQFGMSASQAMDYLTKGFQENLDFSGEFLDSVSEYSTYFAEFGMTSDDMFAKFKSGAESGVFQLDKIGDSMKEMSLRAKDGSKSSTEAYKALGLNAKEMTKQFNKGGEDAKKAFIKVVKALQNTDDETKRNLASTGLWGTQYEDLGEKAFDAMLEASSGLKDVEGATKKASDALQDNLGTRATKVWRDFVADMEPVGETLLDIAEDVLPKVADTVDDVTSAFADLSPEGKKTILAIGGVAAAAGPATMALGLFSSGIGSVMKIGGSLTGVLGKAGGAGLLGRIGMLGPLATNPVGLAIAGTGALALGIYAVTKASQESTEETLRSLDSRKKEIDSMDKLIAGYETLQTKNKLSTDETLRYMDIVDDLKNAKGEDAIKALTDEQNELLKKSGLTNKEMEQFLDYNDKIVEKTPKATQKISEQGNAYAGVAEELQKLNDAERKELTDDTYIAITDELKKQKNLLSEQKQTQSEINSLKNDSKETDNWISKLGDDIQNKNQEILTLEDQIKDAHGEQKTQLESKLKISQQELQSMETARGMHKKKEEDLDKEIGKKQESLNKTNKELEALDSLLTDYGQQVLYEQGIVSEKGKANEALREQQTEVDTARVKLQELFKNQQISSTEYQEQNKKLDEQQGKIDAAKEKLREMNKQAGKTVYKNVHISTLPSIQAINRELSLGIHKDINIKTKLDNSYRRLADPTSKTLNIVTSGGGRHLDTYAVGTRSTGHPGGPAIVGEEGRELGFIPGKGLTLLGTRGPEFHSNLPRGTAVLPNKQTESILKNYGFPGYETGIGNIFSSIPNVPIRTEAMKLLALAGRQIENTKQIIQSPTVVANNNVLQAVLEQNRILMALLQNSKGILQSSKNIENKPIISEGDIGRAAERYDAKQSSKHSVFTGKPF
jgi:phage-related minor tail protein